MKNTVQTAAPSGTVNVAHSTWLNSIVAQLRALGPYVAIELVLPGGTLIAALFWLYRHRGAVHARDRIGALKLHASGWLRKWSRHGASLTRRLQVAMSRRSPSHIRPGGCCHCT